MPLLYILKATCYNRSMSFFEGPPELPEETPKPGELGIEEIKNIENPHEGRRISASLFLLGAIALHQEGCDAEKITAPENETTVITVNETIAKPFEKGFTEFTRCDPIVTMEDGTKVKTTHSVMVLSDRERFDDQSKKFFGARFTTTEIENTADNYISVSFFSNAVTMKDNPCAVQRIVDSVPAENKDRYAALIQKLNTGINVLQSLKNLNKKFTPEAGAVQVEINGVLKMLENEFGRNSYDRELVREAVGEV